MFLRVHRRSRVLAFAAATLVALGIATRPAHATSDPPPPPIGEVNLSAPPPSIFDDTVPGPLADPLTHVLRDLDAKHTLRRPSVRLDLPADFPIRPAVYPGLDGSPAYMLPSASFAWDLGPHPERIFRKPEVFYRLEASATVIAMLAYGFADYWNHADVNAVDWELSWSTPSFRKKLVTFEAVRFDNNRFETNTYFHPVAGMYFYLGARGSGLGIGESFLYSFIGSGIWEYFGEYREKVSLNDQVFTPHGGIAIGEPIHRLGLFFGRSESNIVTEVLALVASPFHYIHHRLGRWRDNRARSLDELGLPADVWHRFDVLVGVSAETGKDGIRLSERRIGLSTELIEIPDYEEPGVATRTLEAGTVSSIRAIASFDDRGMHRMDLVTRLLLGGVYDKKITRDAHGGTWGYALIAGPATSFNYAMHDLAPGVTDKLGIANVLGGTVDLALHHGKTRARVGIDAYGDFAAVYSTAIGAYVDAFGDRGLKTVLQGKQYYFALGVTLRPTLSISYRRFELGGQITQDFFQSIEGLDRFQERVTNDAHVSDRRRGERVWLAYTLPSERLRSAWIELEHVERAGNIGVVRVTRENTDVRLGVAFRF